MVMYNFLINCMNEEQSGESRLEQALRENVIKSVQNILKKELILMKDYNFESVLYKDINDTELAKQVIAQFYYHTEENDKEPLVGIYIRTMNEDDDIHIGFHYQDYSVMQMITENSLIDLTNIGDRIDNFIQSLNNDKQDGSILSWILCCVNANYDTKIINDGVFCS